MKEKLEELRESLRDLEDSNKKLIKRLDEFREWKEKFYSISAGHTFSRYLFEKVSGLIEKSLEDDIKTSEGVIDVMKSSIRVIVAFSESEESNSNEKGEE